jgi:phosphate:Na+ symporter
LNRLLGCVVALVLLPRIGTLLVRIDPDPVRAVADFHTGFNLILAALFLPALGPYAWLLRKLLPARVDPADPSQPRYLDQIALESPPIALGAAAREALRMADALEAMLTRVGEVLASTDHRRIAEVKRLDDVLDRLNTAIKRYLSSLDPDVLSESDLRRLSQVLAFTTNFEAAGDVIDRDVLGHLAKRLKRGAPLTDAEQAETRRLLDRLGATVRAAAAVFMNEDARAARQLAEEKEAFRDLEAAATRTHFAALRGGKARAPDLELVRELKRVNGHLVAAAAYPVLEGQGELLASRLRLDS